MKKIYLGQYLTAIALVWTLLTLSLVGTAQTPIKVPKNKYKIQDDLKIGREASAQVEQQFPILNDAEAARYIQNVGNRLEAAIPSQYRQSQFNCTFKVVNARDINAFALPACYLYVNRGMIE